MKLVATPIGLAGFASAPETDRATHRLFEWRLDTVPLLVALAYHIGAKIGFGLTFQALRSVCAITAAASLTKPNGMGMGLTIVRSIVEAHRGARVTKSVEEGACFSFSLPVTRDSQTRGVVA